MTKNYDLTVAALLLALVIGLVVALEVLGKPVPGLVSTAGTVLLGAVSALATSRGSSRDGSSSSDTSSSSTELPSDIPVSEGGPR